jgi:tRNA nucleotidyltransferase/poly(A) polymerase
MMRAIRFAAQLQFTIDPVTLQAISKHAGRIKIVSSERIAEELNKILLSPEAIYWFVIIIHYRFVGNYFSSNGTIGQGSIHRWSWSQR